VADWLIGRALEKKYGKEIKLSLLPDSEEKQAHQAILEKII